MAIRDRFSRKARDQKLAETVAKAVKAGLAATPMGTSNYNRATPSEPYSTIAGQGIVTGIGQAIPMDRPGVGYESGQPGFTGSGFGAMLGPAAPLLPAPIDVVLDDSGRALPRKYEYQVAQNLNLTQSEVPFAVLRNLAEQCDVIHRAIEIRVGDLVKQDWSFDLSENAIAQIMQDENCSHAKASRIGRERYGDEINRLTSFWKNPYVQSDRSWSEWLTEAMWQIMVFDQLCVYPRYNLGGAIIGMDIIDAPTIKILLDNRGDVPHPPSPAYQQILWGFVRGEFTASPDSDGDFYNTPGKYGEYKTDQLSVFIKNRRSWSAYGFSPVEEAIPAATLYLDRQAWMRAEYQFGSMPTTFMKTNSMELTLEKLSAYERILNDRLTGSTAERHRIKVLPDGFDPIAMPSESERYKSDYDEYIIKRIAACFGVAPSALGVVARAGLGGGKGHMEGEQESSETVSTRPMENYITDVINSLCRRYLDADLNVTFVLQDRANAETMKDKAQALQISLFSGQKTLNDVQGELGQALYEMPEADEPFIVAGSQIQFLKGLLETNATGETTGQKETPSEQPSSEAVQAPAGESKKDTGQESESSSSSAQADLKAQEAKAFAKFASKPRSRKFEFKHHTLEEAEVLKAQITDNPKARSTTKGAKEDMPNYPAIKRLGDKHGPAINAAIKASVTGYELAIDQALRNTPNQASQELILATVQASMGHVRIDPAGLTEQLRLIYEAATQLGGDAAGGFVAGARVAALKEGIGNLVKDINETTLLRIRDVIADGVNQRQAAPEIGDRIAEFVDGLFGRPPHLKELENPVTRGDVIATTEANRAYSLAALDTYQSAGVTQWNWVAYDTACEACLDREANSPYDITDTDCPPEHPNCMCTVTSND